MYYFIIPYNLDDYKWKPEVLSPGEKRQGREADHSSPSSAEVENGGAIPPLPRYVFMVQCLNS
jgi:hypothetical protein